ncbi:unnamed protein product [Urochloa humidicola]
MADRQGGLSSSTSSDSTPKGDKHKKKCREDKELHNSRANTFQGRRSHSYQSNSEEYVPKMPFPRVDDTDPCWDDQEQTESKSPVVLAEVAQEGLDGTSTRIVVWDEIPTDLPVYEGLLQQLAQGPDEKRHYKHIPVEETIMSEELHQGKEDLTGKEKMITADFHHVSVQQLANLVDEQMTSMPKLSESDAQEACDEMPAKVVWDEEWKPIAELGTDDKLSYASEPAFVLELGMDKLAEMQNIVVIWDEDIPSHLDNNDDLLQQLVLGGESAGDEKVELSVEWDTDKVLTDVDGLSQILEVDEISNSMAHQLVCNQLSFSAKKLRNADAFSKSDPMLVIYTNINGKLEEIGRTGVILNSLDPSWITKATMSYQFEIVQTLMFRIYHGETNYHHTPVKMLKLDQQDFLGEACCNLSEIVTKFNHSLQLPPALSEMVNKEDSNMWMEEQLEGNPVKILTFIRQHLWKGGGIGRAYLRTINSHLVLDQLQPWQHGGFSSRNFKQWKQWDPGIMKFMEVTSEITGALQTGLCCPTFDFLVTQYTPTIKDTWLFASMHHKMELDRIAREDNLG